VLVVSGLETVPPQALELARAYHASRTATLLRISARYATPNLFAAAKVAMPGSVLGATLAEWLITGSGVGHLMAADLIGSDFSSLWALVVVVSGVSLLLYELVGALERVAQRQVAA
jgi:sulfonate transport system permease protein